VRWVFLAFLKHYICLALALHSPFSDLEPGHADFVLSAHIVFFSFLLFSKQKGAYTHYIPTPLPHMCTGTCGLAKLHAPFYCASSCVPPSGPTTSAVIGTSPRVPGSTFGLTRLEANSPVGIPGKYDVESTR